MHISIPDVFRAINTMKLYGDEFRPKSFYKGLLHDRGRAADCIACGQCEGVCPSICTSLNCSPRLPMLWTADPQQVHSH